MRTLVLVSHPHLAESRANRALMDAVAGLPGVEVRHLEWLYPGAHVDVAAEQAAARRAQRIVFQFPFYWYAAPPGLKRWMDEVLLFGWAYGPGGDSLRGKILQLVVTAGAPEKAYTFGGYNLFPIGELLRPFEVTAHLTGMKYAPPLVLFDTPNIPGLGAPPASAERLAAFGSRYRALLAAPVAMQHA